MSSLAAQCSTGREPWCFYAHLHRPAKVEETEQGHGPAALQLNEVLEQVFSFVDSTTLCTTAPLVCKQWHAAAQCPLLWIPRLDPQLLAVAAQQQQQQQHKRQHTTSITLPDNTGDMINPSQSFSGSFLQATVLASSSGPSLALLQQAVYGRNLLLLLLLAAV